MLAVRAWAKPGAPEPLYARIYRALLAQAHALAYTDTFFMLTAVAGVTFVLSFFLRANDPGGEAPAVAG